MTTAGQTDPVGVAERLAAIRSAEDLHRVMSELAADANCRWTRTQILFYLPDSYHRIAEEYFINERIVIPRREAIQVESFGAVDLVEALKQFHTRQPLGAHEDPEDTDALPHVSPLDELVAAPPRDENDVIGNVLDAILEEARMVDRSSPKRYRLSGGKCIGPQGEHFVYLFTWSSEPEPFVPGELRVGQQRLGARVGRQSDGEKRFEIWVDEYPGATIERASFVVDPTFLLRSAFEQLKQKRDVFDSGAPLANALFTSPSTEPDTRLSLPAGTGLNHRQRRALEISGVAPRGYVWGPPGTGKTTSLGYLIRSLVSHGQRVLVVSPYNIAVDEAILAAHGRGDWGPEQLVRGGRISDKVKSARIDIDSLLEARARASGLLEKTRRLHEAVMRELEIKSRPAPATVRQCLEDLGEVVISLTGRGDAREITTAIRAIRNKFRAPEGEIINNAAVVGTTIALSYVWPLIHAAHYDHILIDEASVVRVPEALIVAMAATRKITFFGDPKQLPPIVKNKSVKSLKWLKPNPFELAGIREPEDARGACVMLTEQHRMAPPIRSIVSKTFYKNALEDGNCPTRGDLIMVDTSATDARATTRWVKMGPSKENLIHRSVVAAFLQAVREHDSTSAILVLSPYLAQRRAYDAEAKTNRVPNVRFATVHTSQGTESDIVVIDLVIAPGRGKSRFMNERVTPEFRNLMNVAMSRARKQLVIVGHADYISAAYPGGLLERIINDMRVSARWLKVPPTLRMVNLFSGLAI